ncbi:thiamine pyrophosphate-binding protein [Roseomonas sp. CECT 9278]|uniref:thiamine pyrophosphate-binding protein n=1 Tax=Roseomonas sp. CECT 9278 TaxID=2845823 RepID=UPI001E3418AB|nr:thiamine pyrophosphate-binding protein [Roseomonas sp. CECT 9278]CAH0182073.1 Acetolactate synthase large subunit [Roseomonas sp. CECT 9278]
MSASNTTLSITGGEALARMLQAHQVGPMFGMGGFQLLPFYEACRALGLKHHLINDERCGTFAADAWARVTNRPGVVDATLGPGATNLVTGLVESLNAGIPMVAIAGDANREHAWKNMTQEARQVEILRPACKELIRVEHTKRIPELVRRAFAIATSGRPGPVVLDVPEDVAHGEHDFAADEIWADPGTLMAQARRTRPDPDEVERAAALLARAKRPMLLVGGGIHISGAHDALLALAEAQNIPVAHTMSGKGAIPCTHRLSLGVFGRYSRIANDFIAQSDLLIVVGCKLGEIATKRFALMPAGVPVVHIEIVPEEIGRTTRADVALAADARLALADLLMAVPRGALPDERADFAGAVAPRMAAWRVGAADRLESNETPINVGRLINELNIAMAADDILVADGGFAGHWGGLLFDTKQAGRHFIADRGFASIGYGAPGAMGAQMAAGPKRRVVGLTGDGGFNMTIGEIETAKRVGANYVLCVFNNGASGYVKALQHAVYGPGNYQSSDLGETDYAAAARAFGCHGLRVEDPNMLGAAIREGLSNTSTPTILDVIVTRDPARMLPGTDNRTLKVEKGDRPV